MRKRSGAKVAGGQCVRRVGSRRGGQRGLKFADHDRLFGHVKYFGFYLSKIKRYCRVLSRGVT